ncbi:hypothetical protein BGZ63DRAFT_397636 [Mariannaea sp. PMI_226]|nr:hypothetical protein BGZ63DRAFT_397636 [Mariannaea sp. PMI_226]
MVRKRTRISTSESLASEPTRSESDENIFVVQDILQHRIDKFGGLEFLVKWEGYDGDDEKTWEPEEHLMVSGPCLLETYFAKNHRRYKDFSRIDKRNRDKKRKRRSESPSQSSLTSTEQIKRITTTAPFVTRKRKWSPPLSSWETEIETIDAFQMIDNTDLIGYVCWGNGMKTQHPKKVLDEKCPQKVIQFLDSHLRITTIEDGVVQTKARRQKSVYEPKRSMHDARARSAGERYVLSRDMKISSINSHSLDDSGNLVFQVSWEDGRISTLPKQVLYQNIPQKVLQYFDEHIELVFL